MASLLFEKIICLVRNNVAIFALDNPKGSKTMFLGSNCCSSKE